MPRSLPAALAGAALLATAFLPAASLAAEGLQIEPGKWKIQNKRTTELNGSRAKPMNTTIEECMDDQLTIADLTEEAQGNNCSNDEVELSGNRLEWELNCDAPGGKATGTSVFEVSAGGKKITGTTEMKVTGQMKMTVMNQYEATYQGACD